MSKSNDSKGKPPGFDYWSKRPGKPNWFPTGKQAKRSTKRAERREDKKLERDGRSNNE